MILGNDRSLQLIAAKNLPGYDSFLDSSFVREFNHEEPLEVLFPPDHPSAGQTYDFENSDGMTSVFGHFLSESKRGEKAEERLLTFRKDFIYPYHSEIGFRINRSNASPFPASGFILEGSVLRGIDSGASRFYAGPFKGYTKELEAICDDYDTVNDRDSSDCEGWRDGSFYENGYSPSKYDVYNYVGNPLQRIDISDPFNSSFMYDNPFGGMSYSWINIPNRLNRPIPYDLENADEKGNYAVLISRKHALVLSSSGVTPTNLVFYTESAGLTSVQIQATASGLDEIWNAIGIIDKNRDSQTLEQFNGMSDHFEGLTVITFNTALPEDATPIRLYDPNGSDFVFHAMAIGQEGRGHIGCICPPLVNNQIGDFELSFGDPNGCSSMPQFKTYSQYCECVGKGNPKFSLALPMTSDVGRNTISVLNGDIGSPVMTYYDNKPILLGFVSSVSFENETPKVNVKGMGIGSSKEFDFPWRAKFSSFGILNLYLGLTGESASNQKVIRRITDTYQTHPYPDGLYSGV